MRDFCSGAYTPLGRRDHVARLTRHSVFLVRSGLPSHASFSASTSLTSRQNKARETPSRPDAHQADTHWGASLGHAAQREAETHHDEASQAQDVHAEEDILGEHRPLPRLFSVPAPRGTFIAQSTLVSSTEERTRPRLSGLPWLRIMSRHRTHANPRTSPPNRRNNAILRRGLAHPHTDLGPRNSGSAHNAAEPIPLSTGSNVRAQGASLNHSHPTLGRGREPEPS